MPWWAWTVLLVPAAIVAAILLRRAEAGPALAGGVTLAGLDLLVENAGAALGWWMPEGARWTVGVVPVEIVVVAGLAGASLGAFLDRWPGPAFPPLVALAVGGALAEVVLVGAGMLTYAGPWNPGLAFLTYLAALSGTHLVHGAVAGRTAPAGDGRSVSG